MLPTRRSSRKRNQNTTDTDVEGLLNNINEIGINILVEEIKNLLDILTKYANSDDDNYLEFNLFLGADKLFDGFTVEHFTDKKFNGKIDYKDNKSNAYMKRIKTKIQQDDKKKNFGDWLNNVILDDNNIKAFIRTYNKKLRFEDMNIDFEDEYINKINYKINDLLNKLVKSVEYQDIFDDFMIGPIKGMLKDEILTRIKNMLYDFTTQKSKKKFILDIYQRFSFSGSTIDSNIKTLEQMNPNSILQNNKKDIIKKKVSSYLETWQSTTNKNFSKYLEDVREDFKTQLEESEFLKKLKIKSKINNEDIKNLFIEMIFYKMRLKPRKDIEKKDEENPRNKNIRILLSITNKYTKERSDYIDIVEKILRTIAFENKIKLLKSFGSIKINYDFFFDVGLISSKQFATFFEESDEKNIEPFKLIIKSYLNEFDLEKYFEKLKLNEATTIRFYHLLYDFYGNPVINNEVLDLTDLYIEQLLNLLFSIEQIKIRSIFKRLQFGIFLKKFYLDYLDFYSTLPDDLELKNELNDLFETGGKYNKVDFLIRFYKKTFEDNSNASPLFKNEALENERKRTHNDNILFHYLYWLFKKNNPKNLKEITEIIVSVETKLSNEKLSIKTKYKEDKENNEPFYFRDIFADFFFTSTEAIDKEFVNSLYDKYFVEKDNKNIGRQELSYYFFNAFLKQYQDIYERINNYIKADLIDNKQKEVKDDEDLSWYKNDSDDKIIDSDDKIIDSDDIIIDSDEFSSDSQDIDMESEDDDDNDEYENSNNESKTDNQLAKDGGLLDDFDKLSISQFLHKYQNNGQLIRSMAEKRNIYIQTNDTDLLRNEILTKVDYLQRYFYNNFIKNLKFPIDGNIKPFLKYFLLNFKQNVWEYMKDYYKIELDNNNMTGNTKLIENTDNDKIDDNIDLLSKESIIIINKEYYTPMYYDILAKQDHNLQVNILEEVQKYLERYETEYGKTTDHCLKIFIELLKKMVDNQDQEGSIIFSNDDDDSDDDDSDDSDDSVDDESIVESVDTLDEEENDQTDLDYLESEDEEENKNKNIDLDLDLLESEEELSYISDKKQKNDSDSEIFLDESEGSEEELSDTLDEKQNENSKKKTSDDIIIKKDYIKINMKSVSRFEKCSFLKNLKTDKKIKKGIFFNKLRKNTMQYIKDNYSYIGKGVIKVINIKSDVTKEFGTFNEVLYGIYFYETEIIPSIEGNKHNKQKRKKIVQNLANRIKIYFKIKEQQKQFTEEETKIIEEDPILQLLNDNKSKIETNQIVQKLKEKKKKIITILNQQKISKDENEINNQQKKAEELETLDLFRLFEESIIIDFQDLLFEWYDRISDSLLTRLYEDPYYIDVILKNDFLKKKLVSEIKDTKNEIKFEDLNEKNKNLEETLKQSIIDSNYGYKKKNKYDINFLIQEYDNEDETDGREDEEDEEYSSDETNGEEDEEDFSDKTNGEEDEEDSLDDDSIVGDSDDEYTINCIGFFNDSEKREEDQEDLKYKRDYSLNNYDDKIKQLEEKKELSLQEKNNLTDFYKRNGRFTITEEGDEPYYTVAHKKFINSMENIIRVEGEEAGDSEDEEEDENLKGLVQYIEQDKNKEDEDKKSYILFAEEEKKFLLKRIYKFMKCIEKKDREVYSTNRDPDKLSLYFLIKNVEFENNENEIDSISYQYRKLLKIYKQFEQENEDEVTSDSEEEATSDSEEEEEKESKTEEKGVQEKEEEKKHVNSIIFKIIKELEETISKSNFENNEELKEILNNIKIDITNENDFKNLVQNQIKLIKFFEFDLKPIIIKLIVDSNVNDENQEVINQEVITKESALLQSIEAFRSNKSENELKNIFINHVKKTLLLKYFDFLSNRFFDEPTKIYQKFKISVMIRHFENLIKTDNNFNKNFQNTIKNLKDENAIKSLYTQIYTEEALKKAFELEKIPANWEKKKLKKK